MPDAFDSWIENLRYSVHVLASPDRLEEAVARERTLNDYAVFEPKASQG